MLTGVRARVGEGVSALASNAVDRNLRRAQLSFGSAWTAEWCFTVTLGVIAFRDGGASAVGVVVLVRMLPSALLSPLGSTLADRFPRERILMWIGLIRAAAVGAAALIFAVGGPTLGIYALAIVATVAFTVYRPAHSALLPSLCRRPEELTSANIARGLLDSGSTLVGPLLAALLLAIGDPAAALALVAVLSLHSGTLIRQVRYEAPRRPRASAGTHLLAETAHGFFVLSQHRDVRLIVALTLAQTFTRGTFNVFSVVLALELLDTGEAGVGILTGAVGAGAVVGSLAASLLVGSRSLAMWFAAGVATWGLPLAVIGLVPDAVFAVLLLGLVGIGNALVDVGLFTLPGRLVADEYMARVFGVTESLIALSVGIGSIVTPGVIAVVGAQSALVLLGLVAPVLAALAVPRLRALDRRLVVRDREIDALRRVPMFRPLSVPSMEHLAAGLKPTVAEAGHLVIRQGEPGDRFYVITRGEAEVIRDGKRIDVLSAGDGFGEIALLRDVPRTATVRARTQLEGYALERDRFLAAVSSFRASSEEADAVVRRRSAVFKAPPVQTVLPTREDVARTAVGACAGTSRGVVRSARPLPVAAGDRKADEADADSKGKGIFSARTPKPPECRGAANIGGGPSTDAMRRALLVTGAALLCGYVARRLTRG